MCLIVNIRDLYGRFECSFFKEPHQLQIGHKDESKPLHKHSSIHNGGYHIDNIRWIAYRMDLVIWIY